jgi:hypothetical protein
VRPVYNTQALHHLQSFVTPIRNHHQARLEFLQVIKSQRYTLCVYQAHNRSTPGAPVHVLTYWSTGSHYTSCRGRWFHAKDAWTTTDNVFVLLPRLQRPPRCMPGRGALRARGFCRASGISSPLSVGRRRFVPQSSPRLTTLPSRLLA